MGRTSISLDEETKRMLDAVRHEGQSYDGVIKELTEERLQLSEQAESSIEQGIRDIESGRKKKLSEWR